MIKPYSWLLWEQYKESDWRLGYVLDLDDVWYPWATFFDKKIQYNQKAITDWENDCTIVSAMWLYSDLTWYRFSLQEQQEIHDLAVELWLDVNAWRYLHLAIDLIRRYVNGRNDMTHISSAKITIDSEDFWEIISRWFSVQIWYWWNRLYNDAFKNDWEMELEQRGKATYYHAVRRTDNNELEMYIIDNYTWLLKYNYYTIPEFRKILAWWQYYFTYWYFYFLKHNPPMAQLPTHITREQATTPKRREIIIARENEVSKRINDWWDISKLYSQYEADTKEDETDAITRMLNDLRLVRSNLL